MQTTNRKRKIERFWNWINNLSDEKYLRAQRLCERHVGGFVRGIGFYDKNVFLVVERRDGIETPLN